MTIKVQMIYKDYDVASSTGSGGSGCDELGSGRRSSCDDLNARRASCGSIHPSMFGNHGIFAPAEVSVRRLMFRIDTDATLRVVGGTDGSDEQEGAVSSLALPPVKRSKDQEEEPCQVEIRKKQAKIILKLKRYKSLRSGKCQVLTISILQQGTQFI